MTPTFQSIQNAAAVINGVAVKTPLLESPALNELLGCRLFIKAEMLQKTGSFKFRGAYNAISMLSKEQRQYGVFAYSSGNHAQGIALAAAMNGIDATILMPEDTPAIKLKNTKDYGAKVLTYNRYTESREEIGVKIARDQNLTIIKPYDNPHVISGQGTIGLEIIDQLNELKLVPDAIVAPCGGGGLLSGIALATKKDNPNLNIYAAEPENFDDVKRSLLKGSHVHNSGDKRSICDAIVTPTPGEITLPILIDNEVQGLVVSDEEVKQAIWIAFNYFKIVVEPGGAVALAALLQNRIPTKDKILVVVASGGNIDPNLFSEILHQYGAK